MTMMNPNPCRWCVNNRKQTQNSKRACDGARINHNYARRFLNFGIGSDGCKTCVWFIISAWGKITCQKWLNKNLQLASTFSWEEATTIYFASLTNRNKFTELNTQAFHVCIMLQFMLRWVEHSTNSAIQRFNDCSRETKEWKFMLQKAKTWTFFFFGSFSHEKENIVPHVSTEWLKRCVGADESLESAAKMRGNRWNLRGLSWIDWILMIKTTLSASLKRGTGKFCWLFGAAAREPIDWLF